MWSLWRDEKEKKEKKKKKRRKDAEVLKWSTSKVGSGIAGNVNDADDQWLFIIYGDGSYDSLLYASQNSQYISKRNQNLTTKIQKVEHKTANILFVFCYKRVFNINGF